MIPFIGGSRIGKLIYGKTNQNSGWLEVGDKDRDWEFIEVIVMFSIFIGVWVTQVYVSILPKSANFTHAEKWTINE